MRDELLDERPAFVFRHSQNPARVGGKVKRLATRFRDGAHQRLRHWWHSPLLFFVEIAKPESCARVEDRMLSSERFESALHLTGKRIISRPFVSEFCVSTN